ncbi:MAG: carboxypeptidase-like regulatory domain-containing protein, partial [bacterium]
FLDILFGVMTDKGSDSANLADRCPLNPGPNPATKVEVSSAWDPIYKTVIPSSFASSSGSNSVIPAGIWIGPGGGAWVANTTFLATSQTYMTELTGGSWAPGTRMCINGGGKGAANGAISIDMYDTSGAPMNNVATGKVGNVTGRIVNSSTNQPVAGATVTLRRGGQNYTATTDANGKYTFSNLPANDFPGLTYKGNVSATGYTTQNIAGQVVTGNNDWGDTAITPS